MNGTTPRMVVIDVHRIGETALRMSKLEIDGAVAQMQEAFERTMLAGYPRGYDQRTGCPGPLRLDAKPSRYGVITDEPVT